VLNQKLLNEEFHFLQDRIFLDASSVAMPPIRAQKAFHGYMDEYVRTLSEDVISKSWEMVSKARGEISKLINCSCEEVAFVKNTSEGIGIIANGYPFKKGDNVIVADLEHTSNLFAWIHLQRKGIELRVVGNEEGSVSIERIVDMIDENTKVISTSMVQFSTGFRIDLMELGQICKERGIHLCVDGIQGVGRLKLDVKETNISYLSGAGNKGLLGTL
jgi:cysteine desulfurase/selenocysteine lyase